MFKDIEIIEDSKTRVVVRVRIKRRRMAKDPYITADLGNLRTELSKRNLELDLSMLECSRQKVLCNYVEPPVLEADFVFDKPLPKKVPVVNSRIVLTEVEKTDIVQVDSKSGVETTPVTRKRRSRVSTKKQQENKLLGTENLE